MPGRPGGAGIPRESSRCAHHAPPEPGHRPRQTEPVRGGENMAERKVSSRARTWTLAAAILGSCMAFIDGTVVNIAIPVLQRTMGATVSDTQWIVDAYLLVLSSLTLAGGALGDHLGRRKVFAIGIAIFAVASAICGAAGNAQQLIAARAFQGLGAALLVPGSLALITATFPANERGRAI